MNAYVFHLISSSDDNSDSVYFTAGFFEGGSGVGRAFSISCQTIYFENPLDPNTLEFEEQFRTINADLTTEN